MDKGQSEVTNKIRVAIKEKLAEISDFVDDELPEYIMILVANHRSKAQIEKDLSLFLRNDTVNFTNWLWDLLNNLKVCTKSNQSSVSKTEINIINKTIETDEDAVVLDFDPAEHGTDFLSHEDTNDSFLSKSSSIRSSHQDNYVKEPPVTKITQKRKFIENDTVRAKSPVKVYPRGPSHVTKESLSSAIVPVKRKISSEDEYDPDKPGYKKPSFSSSSRKYGGPAALQANKLLLKAVDDATKSILHGKSIEDFYKPTPIVELTSQQVSHPSLYDDENVQMKTERKITSSSEITTNIFEPEVLNYPPDIPMEVTNDDVSTSRSRTICLNPAPLISNTSAMEDIEFTEKNNYPYSFATVEEVNPKLTHFIVTLDGVSRTSLKRKYEEEKSEPESEDSYIDSEEEPEPVIEEEKEPELSPEKKMKLTERCKYWPACKNSDQCSFHHPTVACKCFPDCKFGDKCLYIHPNCKFDALCSRKDCPFTHASKRKLPLITAPVKMVPVQSHRMKVVCKYYPKCTSRNCPFIHPKLCRYGTDCRLPNCLYGHFPLPSRSQMKWHATVS